MGLEQTMFPLGNILFCMSSVEIISFRIVVLDIYKYISTQY